VHVFVFYPLLNININKYGTIILPLILYWCENWVLTLRKERRLRFLEEMVLRKIVGLREWGSKMKLKKITVS
jgi:hypothetical protein